MKRTLVVLLVVLVPSASFVAGARIGTTQHYLADAQYRAAMSAGNLKLIDQGRIDELRTITNINLDGDIARHAEYLDSDWKWLWPELGQDDKAIASAATYRAAHPFKGPDLSTLDKSDLLTADQLSFAKAVAEDYKRDEERRRRMIEKYGKP